MRRFPVPPYPVVVASVALLAVTITLTSSARADECPPGSWFCASVAVPPPLGAAPADGAKATKPEEKKSLAEPTDGGGSGPAGKKGGTETTITTIGDDGRPTTIVVKSGEKAAPPPPPPEPPPPPPPPPRQHVKHVYHYEPAPPPRRFHSEWGINVHVQGASLGDRHERSPDAKMGGMGFALRARPWGHFAFDFGIDFVKGTDFKGYRREEVPFSVSALWFLNPRSKAQLYLLGGLNWSSAKVELPTGAVDQYGYFGAQGGGGLEIRFSRRIAMNLDFIGFIRGRTDQGARASPEFVDPQTGRQTNTSGGGLARLGLTAYWQ